MASRLVAAIVLGALMLSGVTASARKQKTEEELQARIQQEHNPVKKAKLQMELGRLKLQKAIGAYDNGNVSQGAEILPGYVQQMTASWQTLKDSGRQATRHPQGFKELDIALREDSRLLQDLAHRISYFDRAGVEKTGQAIDAVRSEVLQELFPAEHARGKGKRAPGSDHTLSPTGTSQR